MQVVSNTSAGGPRAASRLRPRTSAPAAGAWARRSRSPRGERRHRMIERIELVFDRPGVIGRGHPDEGEMLVHAAGVQRRRRTRRSTTPSSGRPRERSPATGGAAAAPARLRLHAAWSIMPRAPEGDDPRPATPLGLDVPGFPPVAVDAWSSRSRWRTEVLQHDGARRRRPRPRPDAPQRPPDARGVRRVRRRVRLRHFTGPRRCRCSTLRLHLRRGSWRTSGWLLLRLGGPGGLERHAEGRGGRPAPSPPGRRHLVDLGLPGDDWRVRSSPV